jgi:hypothetical protein
MTYYKRRKIRIHVFKKNLTICLIKSQENSGKWGYILLKWPLQSLPPHGLKEFILQFKGMFYENCKPLRFHSKHSYLGRKPIPQIYKRKQQDCSRYEITSRFITWKKRKSKFFFLASRYYNTTFWILNVMKVKEKKL